MESEKPFADMRLNLQRPCTWFANMKRIQDVYITKEFFSTLVSFVPSAIFEDYKPEERVDSLTKQFAKRKHLLNNFYGQIDKSDPNSRVLYSHIGSGSYGSVFRVSPIFDTRIPPMAIKYIENKNGEDAKKEYEILLKITLRTVNEKLPHLPFLIRAATMSNAMFLGVPLAQDSIMSFLEAEARDEHLAASLIVQVVVSIFILHKVLPEDRFCDAHLSNFLLFAPPKDNGFVQYRLPDGSEFDVAMKHYVTSWDFGLVSHCKQREFSAYDYFRSFSMHAGFLRPSLNLPPTLKKPVEKLLYASYVLGHGHLSFQEFILLNRDAHDWNLFPKIKPSEKIKRPVKNSHAVASSIFSDPAFREILAYAAPRTERRFMGTIDLQTI